MASYDVLKSSIQAVIKQNGNNEITGEILQQGLLSIINSLGFGYQFVGIATPSTNPGTPDQKIFYLASEDGIYTNFDNYNLQGGIYVLRWDTEWSFIKIIGVDSLPTKTGQNLVKSSGIYDFVSLLFNTGYDVSNYNDGKLFNVNTKTETSYANGTYQRIDIVSGAAAIAITGDSQGSMNFPILAFFDSSDNLISTYGETSTSYRNQQVLIPENASYAITNAQLGAIHNAKLMFDAISRVNEVFNSAISLKILQMQITDGKVINVNTGVETDLSNGAYGKILIDGEKTIFVTGVQHGSASFPIIAFYDYSNNLLGTFGTAFASYDKTMVQIPNGTTHIIMNVNTISEFGCFAYDFTGKKSGKIFYRISDDRIDVTSKYSSGKDIKMTLYRKSNNLFLDFAETRLIDNQDIIPSQLYGGALLWSYGGDFHGPIKIRPVNNLDGDAVNSHDWTGGAHPYNNSLGGTPTMRCRNIRFFIDGQRVSSSIEVSNYVDGKLFNVSNKTETSFANGTYQRIDLLPGVVAISVTGSSQGSMNFPILAFFDSSNTLISVYGEVNTGYNNEIVNVPSGAAYAITNAQLAAEHSAKMLEFGFRYGFCDDVRIEWTNYIQSYATKKADGTGREILQENHILQFDGKEWKSYVELIALEDLVIEKWNGFQYSCFADSGIYPKVRFLNAVNRQEGIVLDDTNISNDKACSLIRGYGNDHEIEMYLDTLFDIGKREHYTGTWGANTQTFGKGYFFVIGLNANEYADFQINAGDLVALRGKYIFKKVE